ncbi:MAG TPA: DeoR/GlpR family DNA-binding transcription regulator [Chthoniobacterales bacterium]|jgi:DeoR/GlpR family transcriptional regulator of sugar metabolism|nr:DeoR/GlpR family DNA-binding transcription regulator [Chthoniobacterales bacterium]
MLALERQRRIVEMIVGQRSVRTTELAQAFGVTEETIRRDFERLEADGQLSRTHGGAYRDDANRRDIPSSSRETMNVSEKQMIARCAVGEIEAGDTIFLDASSTTLALARLLPELPLTIMTNALKVAVELANRPQFQIIMMGGTLNERSLSCLGPLSEQALECYHVQKAFISCRGVDAVRGLSEANDEQARLKRKIINLSEKTYLLADHSKLPLKSSFFFAQLGEVDALITDRSPAEEISTAARSSGVKVLVASEEVL